MTRLVGIVRGPTLKAAQEQMVQGSKLVDLFEIRLDLLEKSALKALQKLPRDKPLLFTLRKEADGGECTLPEKERLDLFHTAIETGKPSYCDIETNTELAFFERIHEAFPSVHVIASLHNLNETPHELDALLEQMQKPHVSHYKIACKANSTNDAIRLLSFAKDKSQCTAIAIGPLGEASRILSPIISSEFCYASIGEPIDQTMGLLSAHTLTELYRFRALGPHTKIYALLGNPIDKSVGHLFHNQSFPKDAIYVKLVLDAPELPLFFSIMRQLPFAGFSVTAPLKEQLKRFLTRFDPLSEAIGSVNTIVVEEEHLVGYNTDGIGALDALEKHRSVKGLKVALLGAGGSARSIAFEALQRGAHVTAFNRTYSRAVTLAEDFKCQAGYLDEFINHPYDILINTIPVDRPFTPKDLRPDTTVMDIIYWAEGDTPLLEAAKKRGCRWVQGIEMFENQAKLQQKIWFG